jgi:putative glutamine amidotransferase
MTAKMKNKALLTILISGLAILILQGCSTKEDAPPLKIAISRGSPEVSYANYYKWIHNVDSTAICMDMYAMPIDSAMKLFRDCSGLLLTGGTDVNPALYGKAYDTVRCWPINHHLDSLEIALIDSAVSWGMPIMGICRGHQMLNVALGGSLIVDIPSDFDTTISHQCANFLTCFHSVTVDTGSLLFGISGTSSAEVNSNHHQAADLMAPDLKAVAYTSDGLIEAEEWKNPSGRSFLLGVQWHPERLEPEDPLSGPIASRFMKECRKFQK